MCVLWVSAFFVLKALNTKELVLSTFIFIISVLCNYLSMQKCEYSFVGFIINNLLFVAIWLMPVIRGETIGLSVVPLAISGILYITLNIRGVISWRKMKKQHKKEEN